MFWSAAYVLYADITWYRFYVSDHDVITNIVDEGQTTYRTKYCNAKCI
jgi:hypothetical protein